MSKKYFIVSDVHSFYDELQEALLKNGWDINNPNHIFVSCGDLLDRGDKPLECLQFVNSLPKKRKILIRGNHEDLLEAYLDRGCYRTHDIWNGTVDTVSTITGIPAESLDSSAQIKAMKLNKDWQKYIISCVNYAEIGDNIFVHGWIPAESVGETYYLGRKYISQHKYKDNWRKLRGSAWREARWSNGMALWQEGVREPGKTIYCGHWHCSWGHANIHNEGVEFPGNGNSIDSEDIANFFPFYDEGIVAIDACTAVSHMVNCIVIEED